MADRTPNEPGTPDRPLVVAFLSERDAGCPTCGYNLRGLAEDSCTECGERIVLQLAPTRARERGAIRLARTIAVFFVASHAWLFLTTMWFLLQNSAVGFGIPFLSWYGLIEYGIPLALLVAWCAMLYESRRGPTPRFLAMTRRLVYAELAFTILPMVWWVMTR